MSERIERTIRDLLGTRSPGATICPSEAARALWPEPAWRGHMDEVRAVAARLAAAGELEITQGGRPVEAGAVGPIRLRLPRP